MAYLELHYKSNALVKQTACTVILPELASYTQPLPVYYLLHGLSDDHSAWQRNTSIERYVSALPLIVVMPDGGRGWYTDAHEGYQYETSLLQDLIPFIDRMFPTRAERAGRCIGGLSMGGYGAIKLALKNPEIFGSANGHSGAYNFAHLPWYNDEFDRLIGPSPAGGPNDVFALATSFTDPKKREILPQMRIDCGVDDGLLDANRTFHQHLADLKLPHEYAEYPGDHDWGYWDKHVQSAIRFHAAYLGISKPRVKGKSG